MCKRGLNGGKRCSSCCFLGIRLGQVIQRKEPMTSPNNPLSNLLNQKLQTTALGNAPKAVVLLKVNVDEIVDLFA